MRHALDAADGTDATHSTMTVSRPRVLVTGATGYVGGRLVPCLLELGYPVRCLARSAVKLAARPWASDSKVEIVEVDLSDLGTTADAMRGCGPAYYLVHSMVSTGARYADADRTMALTFAEAAERAGISRIIYLGGLGETGQGLSEHLSSRREVERMLASRSVPVTVLRAGMIIGAGSASFEILRYLVERLPVMVTPKWVRTESQPIAIGNVLAYLTDCLSVPATVGRTLDIGGPDIVSYLELMRIMAEERGLPRRFVVPVPVLTPRLSSLWIQLVTPLSHRIARPLAEGLRNRTVCRNDDAARLMPQSLCGVREAIRLALRQVEQHEVETAWSDAGPIPGDPDWAGGTVFVERQQIEIAASPASAFRAVTQLGGDTGWYGVDWLWRVRGAIDRLLGGPGLRRGRRDPDRLAFGAAVDFWRVTAVEPDRRLALRAEMKLPGEALLEFTIEPLPGDVSRCRLVQAARFLPRGLLGLLYWYAVLPLHGIVFGRMLQGIRRVAETTAPGPPAGLTGGPAVPARGSGGRARPSP
jgi:uncharacterized protein YbjT (DUF2867 family)/uncharacterized protein YndB with AHSA1/START domain